MAAAEFETIDEGGFVFKIRKSRLEEIAAAAAAAEPPLSSEGGESHAEVDSVLFARGEAFEDKKKRTKLLALKEIFEAELEAWEKLEAAAIPPVLDEPRFISATSSPEHDPQEEYLTKLKIEVENMEEFIKRLQGLIAFAESTYKMMVKELREDANFRPADEIVLSLTSQATADVDAAAAETPIYVRRGSPGDLEHVD